MKPAEVPALTGLRIVAATWVVLRHFGPAVEGLLPFTRHGHEFFVAGYLGVELFFVLSGFIISYNYADRFASYSAARHVRFLRRRVARLYPVHLATLGAILLLLNGVTRTDLVMNVLMLQAVPPAGGINPPSWSISTELGAYFAFPLVALVLARVRSRRAVGAWIVGCLALVMAGAPLNYWWGQIHANSYSNQWLRLVGEFTAGCFLWSFSSRFLRPSARWGAVAALAAAGVLGVALASPGESSADYLVLPFVALAVVGCANALGPVARLLSSRVMVYGGRISYSLYMTHYVVLVFVGRVAPWTDVADSSLARRLALIALYLTLVVAAAVVTYHLVEEPGRRLIRAT